MIKKLPIELMMPADREYKIDGNPAYRIEDADAKNKYNHKLYDASGTNYEVQGNLAEQRIGFEHDGIDMGSGLFYLKPVTSIFDGQVTKIFMYGSQNEKQSGLFINHTGIGFTFKGKNNDIAAYTSNNSHNTLISSYVHAFYCSK